MQVLFVSYNVKQGISSQKTNWFYQYMNWEKLRVAV
jgi:hypothetical protein